jgi:predicted transposase YbfD/YdcC
MAAGPPRLAGIEELRDGRERPRNQRIEPGYRDNIERETRFYITSLAWLAHQIGPTIRGHWAIENGLHWVMDMLFRDDETRIRKDHAPANFTTLKHFAYNLIRRAPGKDSLRLKHKVAAWDDEFLASLVTA